MLKKSSTVIRVSFFVFLVSITSIIACTEEFKYIIKVEKTGIRLDMMQDVFFEKQKIDESTLEFINLHDQPRYLPGKRLFGVGVPRIAKQFDIWKEGWFELDNGLIAKVYYYGQTDCLFFKYDDKIPEPVFEVMKVVEGQELSVIADSAYYVMLGIDSITMDRVKDEMEANWE